MNKIVMLLTNGFDPDPRVYKEAKSLVNAGFKVLILAWDREDLYPKEEILHGISIFRIKTAGNYGKGISNLLSFLKFYFIVLKQLLTQHNYYLHCHDVDTILPGLITYFIRRIKFIYDPHEVNYYPRVNSIFRYNVELLERLAAKFVDATFYVNDNHKEKLLKLKFKDLIEVRNCPETSFVKNPNSLTENNKKISFGWIGQIKYGVGIKRILSLAANLKNTGMNISVIFVGKVDPNYKGQFDKLMKNFKNLDVHYVGVIPYYKAGEYYRQLNFSLLLYDRVDEYVDSTPTKLYESLAFGIPVLSTPIGDSRKIVENSGGGKIIEFDQLDNLDNIVLELLENPALLKNMGQKGLDYCRNNLNWDIIGERVVDCYLNLD